MALFGKKKEAKSCCGCDGADVARAEAEKGRAGIKVLGSGCAKCGALETAVRDALTALGMDDAVEHVTDFARIAAYGVMTTPALVVDGKVVSCGKVLKKEEVAAILEKARGAARV